jgi:hypothetical protein
VVGIFLNEVFGNVAGNELFGTITSVVLFTVTTVLTPVGTLDLCTTTGLVGIELFGGKAVFAGTVGTGVVFFNWGNSLNWAWSFSFNWRNSLNWAWSFSFNWGHSLYW